nr:tRNA:Cm32/Um32 methyltransferase [Raoultella sp. NCTC 9187]
MLQNIRIVLVETSHTGNMGSVARAMKTMGLTNLWLVNPLVKPDSQAIALAAGASDVIGNAHIVDTLDEALAGCSLVVVPAPVRVLCRGRCSTRASVA